MNTRRVRGLSWTLALAIPLLVLASFVFLAVDAGEQGSPQLKRKSRQTFQEVIQAVGQPQSIQAPAMPAAGFSPQVRLGYTSGDQWEPAIAADRLGHVYVLYPQYLGVPGCPTCYSPTMVLVQSSDRGESWEAPRLIYPEGAGAGQWDAQIVVDPLDGSTVYAAWLQNGKSDTVVARSTDFGATWSVVIADSTNAGTDKPILVVHGQDVYVGFNHAQKAWVAASHDGGQTFTAADIDKRGKLGWALANGGTIDEQGNVYFSWSGYERNGAAKGPVNLFISKSADGGAHWELITLDVSGAPPDCSAYLCGWAFLGAQVVIAADRTGTLYALWSAGETDFAAERMYFARSFDRGATWTSKVEVSTAPVGVEHAFPAIAVGNRDEIGIAWMDDRSAGMWNTFYRSSNDGGATWSAEADLSTYVAGFEYITPDGYRFPFGDYFELDIDHRGVTHAVWGEGFNYDSPGSIWYARGK